MGNVKLSKKKWLFLGISIFVILGAGLGMVWSQQVQEQRQLKQELSLAQLRLNKSKDVQQPSPQQEALQNSLTQIRSQLTTAKASLSQLIEIIEVDETLFGIAETSGVEIIDITSSAPTDMNLEGIPCSALQSSLQIKGDVSNILDFIRKWTEKFHTGVVVSVQITTQAEGSGPTLTPAPTMPTPTPIPTPTPSPSPASATITLLIYTYSGD